MSIVRSHPSSTGLHGSDCETSGSYHAGPSVHFSNSAQLCRMTQDTVSKFNLRKLCCYRVLLPLQNFARAHRSSRWSNDGHRGLIHPRSIPEPGMHSRGSSNSATKECVPKKYFTRPPQQQDFVASSSRPSGASTTDQYITFFPPFEQTGSYSRPAIEPALPFQIQPSCPGTLKDHPCSVNNSSMPAPPHRRSSASSTHNPSRRSSSSRKRGRRVHKHRNEKEHNDHPSHDEKRRELAKRVDSG
jgi:hypothetical protein